MAVTAGGLGEELWLLREGGGLKGAACLRERGREGIVSMGSFKYFFKHVISVWIYTQTQRTTHKHILSTFLTHIHLHTHTFTYTTSKRGGWTIMKAYAASKNHKFTTQLQTGVALIASSTPYYYTHIHIHVDAADVAKLPGNVRTKHALLNVLNVSCKGRGRPP